MTAGCGLETIGLETDRRGYIEVDDHMRTSVEDIYAIGDITGRIQLAHVASAQGMVAASNCAGIDRAMRYDRVPACVYTSPEIAWIGLTEEAAAAQGHQVTVGSFSVAADWGEGSLNFCAVGTSVKSGATWLSNARTFEGFAQPEPQTEGWVFN